MSLEQAAKHLAAHGRGPDTELIHMTKGEIRGLQQLAKANGGSLTVNPHTGLPEAGFLSSILPMAIGAGAMYFSGGAINPATIGAITGGLQYARTGSLNKGLMAGLGAYGGAGLAAGLGAGAAAGSGAAPTAAPVADLGAQAAQAPAVTNAVTQGSVTSQALPSMANYNLASTAAGNTATAAPGMGSMASRIAAAGATPAATPMWKYGLAAAAPALMTTTEQPQTPVGDSTMPQRLKYEQGTATPFPQPDVPGYDDLGRDFGRQNRFFPNAGYQNITPEEAKSIRGYAAGGPIEAMSQANAVGQNTGYPQADITGHAYATPWQTPVSQNVVAGTADTGVNRMTGQMLADGGTAYASGGNVQLQGRVDFDGSSQGGQFAQAGRELNQRGGMMGQPGPFTGNNNAAAPNFDQMASAGSGIGGMYFADGGAVEPTPDFQEPYTAMARGGLSDLGSYSDGGRLLRGPGDGVSDSIPAVIGRKKPARLADGEFVVPARIVSELGNGSTEAGARKLYAMLDRVQSARKKSIGKGKVANNSRADKYLPA